MKKIILQIWDYIISIDFGELWENIVSLITAENIALLSVIITVLIFVATQKAQIRYKKYDDKKIQYLKLIDLLQLFYSGLSKDENGNVILTDEAKKQFFDTGASILLYGSKRIYRKYLLFREFTANDAIKKCKYYKDNILIYVISDIFRQMRKEVGLNRFYNIDDNEALAFFINYVANNVDAKINSLDAKFRIKMIRFELFVRNRICFIWIRTLYKILIQPIFASIIILFKYLILVPLGWLITKLFPKYTKKVSNSENNKDE